MSEKNPAPHTQHATPNGGASGYGHLQEFVACVPWRRFSAMAASSASSVLVVAEATAGFLRTRPITIHRETRGATFWASVAEAADGCHVHSPSDFNPDPTQAYPVVGLAISRNSLRVARISREPFCYCGITGSDSGVGWRRNPASGGPSPQPQTYGPATPTNGFAQNPETRHDTGESGDTK